ncbi:MAG: flippase-like domain-containing protein [Chloroflexi bacterium]|nr:flippase-like domain-containing protein [Chloroflexota bacterium]MBU1750603.1 flippase-like domain-containing protein [Chloroflexota bacterium]MBU1877975.1 flippase-like domain-containing protein [Chloroflexota bacterium]
MPLETGLSHPNRLLSLTRRLALVSGVLFLVILALQVNPAEVLAAFTQVSLPWIIVGFALLVVSYMLRAWRFQILLSQHLPFPDLFYITLVHSFACDVLPLGLGEVFYPGFLRTQRDIPLTESVSSLMVVHILDLLTLGIFFVVALPNIATDIPWLMQIASVINLMLVAMLGAVGILWVLRRSVLTTWDRWATRQRPAAGPRAGAVLDLTDRTLRVMLTITSARTLVMSGALTVLLWLVTLGGTAIIYQGMGLILKPWALTLLISLMYFFGVLPIHSVGGIGTLDSLWVILIMAFGIPQGPALSYTILRRVLSSAFSLFMGGIGLFKLGIRPWSRQSPANHSTGDDKP